MHTRIVYLCGFARTPHGKFMGALKDFSVAELGGFAIKALLERYEVPREDVDGVFMGEVLTAGEGQNPARHAAMQAGLPKSCQAETFNKVCSSSLAALRHAFNMISVGAAEVMIAGGQESMSRTPYFVRRATKRMGDINLATLYEDVASSEEENKAYDSMFYDGLSELSRGGRPTMAVLSDRCAIEHNIPRDAQDYYAFMTCARARMAHQEKFLKDCITPIAMRDGTVLEHDETLRPLDLERAQKARATEGCSTVTAATMSQLADGASALLLASPGAVDRFSLKPLARIAGFSVFSHDLDWYPTAPVGAIRKLLAKSCLKVSDIGSYEVNEASAVVPLYTERELMIPCDRLNMWGGSIAIGHPLGATGARLTGTLALQMQKRKLRYGIATTCNGGGEAMSVLLESK